MRIATAVLVSVLPVMAQAQGSATGGPGGLFAYFDAASVARGETLYADHCAACHGAALEGAPDWQRRGDDGRMPAPPHDASGHTWHHPDTLLFLITKFGSSAVVGNGYESDMIGFGDILGDAEILEVLAYIKSTWPDRIQARHDALNAANASQ